MYSTTPNSERRPTEWYGKLEGVATVSNRVTPMDIACQSAVAGKEVSELTVDAIRHVSKGGSCPESHESNDCNTTVAEGEVEKSGIVGTEGWVEELTRVSSTHLPPGHPC